MIKLKPDKYYIITNKNGYEMKFWICSIDKDKDEVYIKVVSPIVGHIGLHLSSIYAQVFLKQVKLTIAKSPFVTS
jgi:hypothetical protein